MFSAAVVETGLSPRLDTEFFILVGVFTGVAGTCASLFGSGLFLGVGECALLFAGDGEPPVLGAAGVVCNEPLDLLLFTTCLPGGEEGKE